MRLFETVRANITARKVAEYNGIHVNRSGMACCPFHNDKHPSLKLDQRFHCFGCQADGDAIDFVGRLYGLNAYESAKKIAEDFGLEYEGERKNVQNKTHYKKEQEKKITAQMIFKLEAEMNKWKKHAIEILDRYNGWLIFWKDFYKPEKLEDEWNPLFVEALEQMVMVGYYLDILLTGDDQDCLDFSEI